MNTHLYTILSVGGSIIIPKTGFDIAFLKRFRTFVLSRVKKGERLILIIGGGKTAREYQGALNGVLKSSNTELDWIGIHATRLNAELVRMFLSPYTHSKVIENPTQKIKTNKPILIACGWKPGCSTDMDAVLLAKTYGVKQLLNLSNIEYVYDKDPNVYSDAKKIERMNWASFRTMVGNTWGPGMSAPFDPIASKTAQKFGLTVSILQGTNLKEVGKALDGKVFRGTIISR